MIAISSCCQPLSFDVPCLSMMKDMVFPIPEYAIKTRELGKMYKLFRTPGDKILDAFGVLSWFLWKKQAYHEFWALQDVTLEVARGEQLEGGDWSKPQKKNDALFRSLTVPLIGLRGASGNAIFSLFALYDNADYTVETTCRLNGPGELHIKVWRNGVLVSNIPCATEPADWTRSLITVAEAQKVSVPSVEKINSHAPHAVLVFDKFHIIRHLMDAVDAVRRDEISEKGKDHKELVAHTRYIWLKNPWNLTDNQKSILNYFDVPLTNATVEGLNNKAKKINHKAYGYRSVSTFILNLYHGLADLSLPKTMHTFV